MIVPRDKLILWIDQQAPPELQTGKAEPPKQRPGKPEIQPEISITKEFLQFLRQKEAANELRFL